MLQLTDSIDAISTEIVDGTLIRSAYRQRGQKKYRRHLSKRMHTFTLPRASPCLFAKFRRPMSQERRGREVRDPPHLAQLTLPRCLMTGTCAPIISPRNRCGSANYGQASMAPYFGNPLISADCGKHGLLRINTLDRVDVCGVDWRR